MRQEAATKTLRASATVSGIDSSSLQGNSGNAGIFGAMGERTPHIAGRTRSLYDKKPYLKEIRSMIVDLRFRQIKKSAGIAVGPLLGPLVMLLEPILWVMRKLNGDTKWEVIVGANNSETVSHYHRLREAQSFRDSLVASGAIIALNRKWWTTALALFSVSAVSIFLPPISVKIEFEQGLVLVAVVWSVVLTIAIPIWVRIEKTFASAEVERMLALLTLFPVPFLLFASWFGGEIINSGLLALAAIVAGSQSMRRLVRSRCKGIVEDPKLMMEILW